MNMVSYDLIARLNETFRELEQYLHQFREQLEGFPIINGRVFILPEIKKGQENMPLDKIFVSPHSGQQAHDIAMKHFTRLFIQQQAETLSSKAAVRLPGAICYDVNAQQYRHTQTLIDKINLLKQKFERIISIESGLPASQRFEWVHQHIPGLITLNAYRTITQPPVPDTVRFGWANKHIIKNYTPQEVVEILQKSLKANRAVPPYTREEWAGHITRELNDVQRLPASARLKIKRPVKVQPIARIWYQAQQKQIQYACPSPLIILCQKSAGEIPPEIGELNNYDAQNIQHRHKPRATPLKLLIPRLHLYYEA